MNLEKATQVMLHVHTRGRGVCGVFTREIAESKVAQVNEYARLNQHPLLCTMEKVLVRPTPGSWAGIVDAYGAELASIRVLSASSYGMDRTINAFEGRQQTLRYDAVLATSVS